MRSDRAGVRPTRLYRCFRTYLLAIKLISYEDEAALSEVDLAKWETEIVLSVDKGTLSLGNKKLEGSAAA